MSYTIIVDEDEGRRQAGNLINVAVRHCKIGKVRVKHPKKWDGLPDFIKFPHPSPSEGFIPWWERGPWCKTFVA